jgi:gamma-glutamylcyclotransferase (GGCT)/AIG2-like uncharacterized protein YtfP
MTEIKLPDYLFVYGILNDGRHSAATLGNAVKVRKAYGNAHVCLESYEHGEVDGSLLPVQSAAHLEELDYIEGSGYERVTIECDEGAFVQTYWYKDMPLNVDTSTGKNDLVLLNSFLINNHLVNLHRGVFRNV